GMFNGRETPRVIVRRQQGTVEVKFHAARSGDAGDMIPAVCPERSWYSKTVQPLFRIPDKVRERPVRIDLNTGIASLLSVSKKPRPWILRKTSPANPGFHRGGVEVIENIWRHFDVTCFAVEIDNPILRPAW